MPLKTQIRTIAFALATLACLTNAHALQAHVDIPKPERLIDVRGIVVNSQGKPVSGAPVTLERNGKVLFRHAADSSGRFKFGSVHGDFIFRVGRTQYSSASLNVIVGDDLVVLAERKNLYVIVGPGECENECSTVTTDKSEFKKILKRKQQILARGTAK